MNTPNKRGQGIIEYILIIGLILVVAYAAATASGISINLGRQSSSKLTHTVNLYLPDGKEVVFHDVDSFDAYYHLLRMHQGTSTIYLSGTVIIKQEPPRAEKEH